MSSRQRDRQRTTRTTPGATSTSVFALGRMNSERSRYPQPSNTRYEDDNGRNAQSSRHLRTRERLLRSRADDGSREEDHRQRTYREEERKERREKHKDKHDRDHDRGRDDTEHERERDPQDDHDKKENDTKDDDKHEKDDHAKSPDKGASSSSSSEVDSGRPSTVIDFEPDPEPEPHYRHGQEQPGGNPANNNHNTNEALPIHMIAKLPSYVVQDANIAAVEAIVRQLEQQLLHGKHEDYLRDLEGPAASSPSSLSSSPSAIASLQAYDPGKWFDMFVHHAWEWIRNVFENRLAAIAANFIPHDVYEWRPYVTAVEREAAAQSLTEMIAPIASVHPPIVGFVATHDRAPLFPCVLSHGSLAGRKSTTDDTAAATVECAATSNTMLRDRAQQAEQQWNALRHQTQATIDQIASHPCTNAQVTYLMGEATKVLTSILCLPATEKEVTHVHRAETWHDACNALKAGYFIANWTLARAEDRIRKCMSQYQRLASRLLCASTADDLNAVRSASTLTNAWMQCKKAVDAHVVASEQAIPVAPVLSTAVESILSHPRQGISDTADMLKAYVAHQFTEKTVTANNSLPPSTDSGKPFDVAVQQTIDSLPTEGLPESLRHRIACLGKTAQRISSTATPTATLPASLPKAAVGGAVTEIIDKTQTAIAAATAKATAVANGIAKDAVAARHKEAALRESTKICLASIENAAWDAFNKDTNCVFTAWNNAQALRENRRSETIQRLAGQHRTAYEMLGALEHKLINYPPDGVIATQRIDECKRLLALTQEAAMKQANAIDMVKAAEAAEHIWKTIFAPIIIASQKQPCAQEPQASSSRPIVT